MKQLSIKDILIIIVVTPLIYVGLVLFLSL